MDRCGDWLPIAVPSEVNSSPPPLPDTVPDQPTRPSIASTAALTDPTIQAGSTAPHFTKRYVRNARSILCLGLDMAWWGGRSASPESQNDVLSYLVVGDKMGTLQMRSLCLATTYDRSADQFTANCDPAARIIVTAIAKIIEEHTPSQVVLAVDAPLIAMNRDLPERSKIPSGGTLARRQPEQVLAKAVSAGPARWRPGCNIQPGAPVCSRVKSLVDALTTQWDFQLYSHWSPDTPKKSLVGCFPSEAIWALGCLNHYGTITPEQTREYKRFENRLYPFPLLMNAAYLNLAAFISAIGVPGPRVREWIAQLSYTILTDPQLLDSTGKLLRGGKLFDDVIDSVNALFTAVSFCYDASHVWMGCDPEDGHIVGPVVKSPCRGILMARK